MEILCACDGRFLPHTATMLCSLLEHNRIFQIHVFHDTTASSELPKLKSFIGRYGCTVVSYQISPKDLPDLRVDGHASIANYYRLLAPLLLPRDIEKVLYLDSDIVIRQSLGELWNIDLTDHALAAVEDYYADPGKILPKLKSLQLPLGAKYFNSGVMLINLTFWRLNNVSERAIRFISANPVKVDLWDQDALNAILVHRWIELPSIWNAQHNAQLNVYSGQPVRDAAIVHFVGPVKPWDWSWRLSTGHPFRYEYQRYRRRTPWPRYRPAGSPNFKRRVGLRLRIASRAMLPGSTRQWLGSRIPIFRFTAE
jgi:UDP-glucose/galactose:(glucosyl)LPS alpha-1,2-glucosyl/galactosyltransferase